MTAPTQDLALAGMQAPWQIYKAAQVALVAGRPFSTWPLNGCPAAGTYNSTINGAVYSSTSSIPAGSIYHTDPAGGVNAYLATFLAQAEISGTMLLCDRLWDNQIVLGNTSSQAIVTPTWPARDRTGATSGADVHIAIESSVATAATAAALTNYTYTNSAGTGSRTGNFIDAPTAVVSQPGYFYRLYEQAGDLGVQSVQSIQFSTAWTVGTGTVNMVAYRVITAIELPAAWTPNRDDVLSGGLPQIYNGACPFFVFIPNTTTVGIISGAYQETQI